MLLATQIRAGMYILHEGEPHRVVHFQHTVTARGSSCIPAKLRNIIDHTSAEVRYRSDDKVEQVFPTEREMEYLYQDGDELVFMDNETFEQYHMRKDDLEDSIGYLLPNTQCRLQLYEDRPIGVKLPQVMQFRVAETEPMIKGATASGNVGKPAKLETGLVVQVPMFVDVGNIINVNTVSGEYEGRPKG